MDEIELDPFSTREKLSVVFPSWMVTLCGPYFDEVGPLGRALIWLKWILLIAAPAASWFLYVDRLVPEEKKPESALGLLVLGTCGLVWSLSSLRRCRKEDKKW